MGSLYKKLITFFISLKNNIAIKINYAIILEYHEREIAQLGRALGLGPRCRRFESCFPDHLNASVV